MSILQEFVQNGCVVIDLSEELGDFHDNFSEKMDSVPPKWVFAPMSGRSINEYNYKK